MQVEQDKLELMFHLREDFMRAINDRFECYPSWPIDIANKKNQQILRELALKGVEEMFESLQHLKNWKSHKVTEDVEFNRSEFLEEVVDAFNYFFSMLVLVGVNAEELAEMYQKKDKIIHARLKSNY